MKLSDFDYHLPRGLIAQTPLPRRDASRLLVLDRTRSTLAHRSFPEVAEFLDPGDLLILNDTKVRPARLRGWKDGSGGKVEILLLKEKGEGCWEALLKPGSKVKKGQRLILVGGRLGAVVLDEGRGSRRLLQFNANGNLQEVLQEWGEMPLPPYIKRDATSERAEEIRRLDAERYQTVFARHEGAVAAPTAGLHFTADLLRALPSRGVQVAYVTLHVGPGTFQPVRCEEISAHPMESEEYFLPLSTAEAIADCRGRGGRVIAVGTTCVRALESAAGEDGAVRPGPGVASLFIYPGYRFRVVDGLLTNFHLPRSTLLMLVSAFAGRDLCRRAYGDAIAMGYRFYSYGDAMLIL